MKKIYKKPLIIVERMELSEPIALNCTASADDMQGLLAVGVFTREMNCTGGWLGTGDEGTGGKWDLNMNGIEDGWDTTHDTVCYHSNLTIAFKS